MKTYNNLYNKLYSLDNLKLAHKRARKGKTSKWYVKKFESNLNNELLQLKYELETQTYEPQPLKRFIIRDPKSRVIHASNFRDRVIHHAICNIIEPIFDKTFIYDSYASRKNKGTLAAVNRFDRFKRRASSNGKLIKNAKDSNMIIGYFLKADIKHYFNTVSHSILIDLIKKKIRDRKVLQLIRTILAVNSDYSRIGMPVGNLTSQFFANIYLNKLDYFIKHKLKAKYYLRYVDDFVILHKNRATLLNFRRKINEFLKTKLKIELHEEKSQVYPLHSGINLLGFRVFYHYKLLRKRNIRKIKQKLRNCNRIEVINGWLAYAKWANTYKLRTRLYPLA